MSSYKNSIYKSEELDKKEYENIKAIALKTNGKDFKRWLEHMEEFRKIILKNNRNIKNKYRNMTFKEKNQKVRNQPETMKQRIETLKQYPYVDKYFEDLNKYLSNTHGHNDFCEMVVSDEFKVFSFETSKKELIVVISGWDTASRDNCYHHIKALCILPKNHKLTIHEFIKVEKETKASEVKVINENEIITYKNITKEMIIENINTIGNRPGYSLNISRI